MGSRSRRRRQNRAESVLERAVSRERLFLSVRLLAAKKAVGFRGKVEGK